MKRILVAGGAGFLGSHLCDRLIEQGHYVTCVDNLSTGSKNNISHLIEHSNFKFIEADVSAHDFYVRIIGYGNLGDNSKRFDQIDQIYNMACPASPPKYQESPVQTIRTNVLGSINLLDIALTVGAKILQASTSEVYGDPEVHPQPEYYWGNVNPIGIRSCYDEGKRCAETLFFDYHRQYGVNIKIARIFNTYGPRMDANDGRVVSNFINQALKDDSLTIYGVGQQTRSFCYVDDTVDGLIKLMNTPDTFTGPVNIGNPNEFTMMELAEKVIKLTNSKSQLIFKPLPSDDPKKRKPDISLAKEVLNWEPTIQLEEGLKKTISYFEKP